MSDGPSVVRINGLRSALMEQTAKDIDDVRKASRASELISREEGELLLVLPDEELEKRGWSRNELIVATHAVRSAANAPYYLKMAHERMINHMRDAKSQVQAVRAQGFVLPMNTESTGPRALAPSVDENDL